MIFAGMFLWQAACLAAVGVVAVLAVGLARRVVGR